MGCILAQVRLQGSKGHHLWDETPIAGHEIGHSLWITCHFDVSLGSKSMVWGPFGHFWPIPLLRDV